MQKHEIGTLWVDTNGDAYRLRDYRTDWQSKPFSPEEVLPTYSVSYMLGGFSSVNTLPAGARMVWKPEPKSMHEGTGDE